MATMDPTMELFGSAAAPSAPPSDGDDTYDAREREIEGGGGADAPGTLHLAVSRLVYLLSTTTAHAFLLFRDPIISSQSSTHRFKPILHRLPIPSR